MRLYDKRNGTAARNNERSTITMKKLVCFVLGLTLCLSASAMAESLPSKTTSDLTRFEVVAENQPNDPDIYLLPVNEVTVGVQLPDYQERIDVCQVEIEKLAASENAESYFAGATDSEGNPVNLRELLGVEEDVVLNVFEFCPAIAGGFQEDCGKVTATLLFSTPYEKDEKVLVLIGIVTILEDGTQNVAWQVFEGIGLGAVEGQEETYGSIQVELTPEIVAAIQNELALLAVVSE